MRALHRQLIVLLVIGIVSGATNGRPAADEPWRMLQPSGAGPAARHEAAAMEVDGLLYLMGGRGTRPIEVFDPTTKLWQSLGASPVRMHHFQPVAIGSTIYVIGALTGSYPDEPSIADIWAFDTTTHDWNTVGRIPTNRLRGSTGAVAHDGDIYIVGGNLNGHSGPSVAWLDRFDPETGDWEVLLDAPHARDHAYAAHVGDRLYFVGGRRTDLENGPFDNTEIGTDVYDFRTGEWSSAAPLPTARAGAPVVTHGREVIVIGGEIASSAEALDRVEALDVDRDTWRTLQPLLAARHSGGAAIVDDSLHVVAGNASRGGGDEIASHEILSLDGSDDPDRDRDGLDNDEELRLGTDPDDPDTDGDGLADGDEVERRTDPQRTDTDGDRLNDGEEVSTHGTDPLREDTDSDGIADGDEIAQGTDPNDENDPGVPAGSDNEDAGDLGGPDGGSDGATDSDGTTDAGSDSGASDGGDNGATTADGGNEDTGDSGVDGETAGDIDGGHGGAGDEGTTDTGSDAGSDGEGHASSGGGAISNGDSDTDGESGDDGISDSTDRRSGGGAAGVAFGIALVGLAVARRRPHRSRR